MLLNESCAVLRVDGVSTQWISQTLRSCAFLGFCKGLHSLIRAQNVEFKKIRSCDSRMKRVKKKDQKDIACRERRDTPSNDKCCSMSCTQMGVVTWGGGDRKERRLV